MAKNKLIRKRDWCSGGGKLVHHGCHGTPKRNRFVRCGECGQRFEVYLTPNECCNTQNRWLPKHKAYVK